MFKSTLNELILILIMLLVSSSSSSSSNFICHYNKHTDATHRQQNYLHSIIMARRYRKTFRLSSQDTSWLGCIVIVFVSEGD